MIWMEGFDGPGTIAALNTKLNFSSTAPFSLESALTGTGSSLKQSTTSSTDVSFSVTLPSSASPIYLACKMYVENAASGVAITDLMVFRSGGYATAYFNFTNSGNSLQIESASAINVGSVALPVGEVFSLRIYLLPEDSGNVKVWINGEQKANIDADFKSAAAPGPVDNVTFKLSDYTGATSYTRLTIDHLVISDSSIPDCKITTYRPVADGNYAQFTPSTGSDHYALVDETTLSTTDYNGSSTSGHIDTFKFTEPSITGEILGVALEHYVNKSDSGARTIRPIVRQSGTDYTGSADLALTEAGNIASQYYETNPATSSDFTVAELTGASRTEFGLKIQS